MRIVVLDGYALNPGDLSWAALEALGECTVHDRSAAADTVNRARRAEIALTNKVVLGRAELAALPALRYIGVLATGYNVVDVAAARERQIAVTNVPAYSTASVAQLTMALLLELAHRVGDHAADVRAGGWSRSPDFCYWKHPLVELAGLTLGIVGLGQIGRAVARLAQAFGMRVIGHTRTTRACEGVEPMELDLLFRTSDVVSLHCPLTPETRHLVDAGRLALMKPTAFLLNPSRGPLVDEQALADALNQGRIAGAALDVLAAEPPAPENPLLATKNCLITPHIAWATRASRQRLMDEAVQNVQAFLAGKPRNVVS
jgi:glycerate dehydrogenase